ncbi:MAG: HD domain-containing protein [Bacillota bacterium]|nr:HD domain-containing protein [Bacillota bacterium]
MSPREVLEILKIAERLKDTTRHCYTSKGRHESVAEHTWMMSLIAFLIKEEFPEADMNKVLHMIIIHDLGEAFTGDIPVFEKNNAHEKKEEDLLMNWLETLEPYKQKEMVSLLEEMKERKTLEAKIFKAIDSLEALIQHNLSSLDTWIPLEYDLQKEYAWDRVEFSSYFKELREEILKDTLEKIESK